MNSKLTRTYIESVFTYRIMRIYSCSQYTLIFGTNAEYSLGSLFITLTVHSSSITNACSTVSVYKQCVWHLIILFAIIQISSTRAVDRIVNIITRHVNSKYKIQFATNP